MPNSYLIAVEAAQNCDLSDLRELHEYIGLLLRDREQEAADETEQSASGFQSPR